jgi:hypothetical protein
MMKRAICAAAWAILATAASAEEKTAPFPVDKPMSMRAIEAVCTGITSDARADPRWAAYPLRIEVVGAGGEFLADAQVTLSKGDEALAAVNCAGPWVLFKVMPGAYSVSAEIAGTTKTARVNVGASDQARVILRFAEAK